MENKELHVSFGENIANAELTIRKGEAAPQLATKPPIQTNIYGVINAPLEYLTKRVGTGQFTQERSHLIVNRENVSLELHINEDDFYNHGIVRGVLAYNTKFIEFGINQSKMWTPSELGMFFKMNRAFFPNRPANMELVTQLMNFTATVNNKIERSVKENGDRTDNFAQVVNSNLPDSFTLQIPIFKSMAAETLEVETFAAISGREVAFALLSPSANQLLEDVRNRVIDEQLEKIRAIAPNLAIIEE